MDLLIYLLGIDTPSGTSLVGLDFGARGWWLLAVTLIGLVLFGAAAAGLYWLESKRLSVGRRLTLAILRTLLLTLLLVLIFRPVVLAEFEGRRPRPVVLLLDNSQSMSQADKRLTAADRVRVAIAHGLLPATISLADASLSNIPDATPKDPARIDLVKAVLRDGKRDLLGQLQKIGPLRSATFGSQLRSVLEEGKPVASAPGESPAASAPGAKSLLGFLTATEEKTALADAINEILQRKDGDLPAAIVVATDGQDNASKLTLIEAAQECARLQVPLHIYGVGSTEGGTLFLKDALVPDTIFYDDTVALPVRWRAEGFKKGTIHVVVKLGEKVVADKEFPVKTGADTVETLSFTPAKGKESEEKLDLTVQIRLKENDAFKDKLIRPVRLSDSKVKILYIEYSPRWEFKFLQPALIRDRRVEAHFILIHGDPKLMKSGKPFLPEFPTREELLKYDLIILGDIPASYLGPQKMEWIKEYVRDFKGGLILIAGRQNAPRTFDGTPLAELLPVEFLPVEFKLDTGQRTQSYVPVLTTAGESSDMLMLADAPPDNQQVWKNVPGFHWYYPVTKLRPAATALLVHPTAKMGDQPMPLLATQYYGKGQVLFLGTDETWRWRWNTQDKYFGRFWGQVIYQLGLPHLLGDSSKRVQAALERSEAILGRPGAIYVRLLDRDFRPLQDEEVTATLDYLDAKAGQERNRKVTLRKIPGRAGDYRVVLENDQPGRFELRVKDQEGTFQYRVNLPPRHELEESGLAEEPLREAAQLSGGKFYREEDLHHLPAQVQPRLIGFTLRQEVLLWNGIGFIVFLGLITAEWLIRKFSDLS